jgi:hypothetical protein
MPTRPGQVPDQLATVRMGPRWVSEAVEDVVGILPDGFGDDEGRFGSMAAEDFQALLFASR